MFKYPIKKDISAHLKTICCAVLLTFLIPRAEEFVVISELLKNPTGGSEDIPGDKSHEFIELANLGTEPFSIDSLFLFNKPGGVDSIIVWDTLLLGSLSCHANCIFNSRLLLPGKIAVIVDPDYKTAVSMNAADRLPIDSGTTLWTIDDNAFGYNGLSENDGVVIFKGTKTTLIRLIAFAGDSCGPFTLADTIRQMNKVPEGLSVVPGTLLFCPPSFFACPSSPGHYEKLKNNWLVESKCWFSNRDSANALCSCAILKSGSTFSGGASWAVVRSIPQKSSIVKQGVFEPDRNLMKFALELPLDSASNQLRVSENSVITTWNLDLSSLWAPPQAIKINEVFPRAQTDVPEWFELANASTMPLSIKNWRFGNSESCTTLTQDEVTIPPTGFCVITKDKRLFSLKYPSLAYIIQPQVWLSLDNNRDTLRLWDNRGRHCETIAYQSDWFERWTDQSIERVSLQKDGTLRDAWAVAARPSPGQPNGSVSFRGALQPALEIGPVRFTPNGDGRDDLLSIIVTLPAAYGSSIAVYGFNGRKYVDLPSSPQPRYFWDGKTSSGAAAPPGPFFVVATFKNNMQTIVIRKKGILWR
jgi:hypothetical protein